MAVDVGESYQLPPYSTVIGFVHNMCGFAEYHPMKVSIQGDHTTMISDLYTRYFFGASYDKERHNLKVENSAGKYDGITRGLGSNELLVEVMLVLHILPEKEEDFEAVLSGLKAPKIYPSLGRYEDILRIDDISVVEIVPTKHPNLLFDAYIPKKITSKRTNIDECSRYTLNKVYRLSDEKSPIRIWEKVEAYHVAKDTNVLRCYGGATFEESCGNAEISCAYEEKDSKIGIFFA
jgi:CRISPR-associated protein Cas5t